MNPGRWPLWMSIGLPVVLTLLMALTEGWKYALGLSVVALVIGAVVIAIAFVVQRARR